MYACLEAFILLTVLPNKGQLLQEYTVVLLSSISSIMCSRHNFKFLERFSWKDNFFIVPFTVVSKLFLLPPPGLTATVALCFKFYS